MRLEKSFQIKGKPARYPIVQGGMGVGISLHELATAVTQAGCVGTISSAAIDSVVAKRLLRKKMDTREAAAWEVSQTKRDSGMACCNIMVALQSTYAPSVAGAIDGGVDIIVSGAGLPMNLPSLVAEHVGTSEHDIALVPIVSSARALELICKRWDKQGYRPDAVVLEGPKAGGHLGWNYKQLRDADGSFLATYDLLDVLLNPVLDVADKYKNDAGAIPVIVAGGIYDHQDIVKALSRGASAVQMGTRFAATVESGGNEVFKRTLVEAKAEDIVVADESWGSPCGLPFRYVRTSPLAQKPRDPNKKSFCICTTLLATAGIDHSEDVGVRGGLAKNCPEELVRQGSAECPANGCPDYTPIVTCGTEAYRVDRIMKVQELIDELLGHDTVNPEANEPPTVHAG